MKENLKAAVMPMTIIVIITVIVSVFVGCAGKGTNVPVNDSSDNYRVEKLFTTEDGITVYRFYDGGYRHYFTNRAGSVIEMHSNGKTTWTEEVNCN